MRRRVRRLLSWRSQRVTVAGCSQTVGGTAQRAHPGVPDPDRSYGYVDDRCGLLDDSSIQETLGADEWFGPTAARCASTCCARRRWARRRRRTLRRSTSPSRGSRPAASTANVNWPRARGDGHRQGRRTASGIPGAPRHHRRGLFGHGSGRHRRAELVGAVPRSVRTATRARTPRSCSSATLRRTCEMPLAKPLPASAPRWSRRRRARRCGAPDHPRAGRTPAAPPPAADSRAPTATASPTPTSRKAVGSTMFTKAVVSDAGLLLAGEHRARHVRAGMGISTWWYRGSDMDTERTLEQQAGRTLTELSIDGNKGFKATTPTRAASTWPRAATSSPGRSRR